jgi:phosphate transport system protein
MKRAGSERLWGQLMSSAMFDWIKRLASPPPRGLDSARSEFLEMITTGRHMLELAGRALLGEASVAAVRDDLFASDRLIDTTEQKLRRDLMVHASVGGSADFPTCLVLMSIAKDAERIGDYCKNLFDVAVLHVIGPDHPQHDRIADIQARALEAVSGMIATYRAQDLEAARRQIKRAGQIEDECDARINALITDPDEVALSGPAVATALALRYQKRIVSHAMNIATSIVMPADKIDFFDER